MKEFNDDMTPLDRVDSDMADHGSVDKRPSVMQNTCLGNDRNFPLAMVYSPMQKWGNLYTPEEALKNGTLFADLNFPWIAGEKGSKWNDR